MHRQDGRQEIGPEVETFVLGKMAFEGPDMRRDTIFRIASMTKPVTARLRGQ